MLSHKLMTMFVCRNRTIERLIFVRGIVERGMELIPHVYFLSINCVYFLYLFFCFIKSSEFIFVSVKSLP